MPQLVIQNRKIVSSKAVDMSNSFFSRHFINAYAFYTISFMSFGLITA